jgi:hypothetical protein
VDHAYRAVPFRAGQHAHDVLGVAFFPNLGFPIRLVREKPALTLAKAELSQKIAANCGYFDNVWIERSR